MGCSDHFTAGSGGRREAHDVEGPPQAERGQSKRTNPLCRPGRERVACFGADESNPRRVATGVGLGDRGDLHH